jgi:lysophospholipase L1-like esterase
MKKNLSIFPASFYLFIVIFLSCGGGDNSSSSVAISTTSNEIIDCKDKIVFIGDSITEGCNWNELLGRNDIVNKGIKGDSTKEVLSRLDVYLRQKPKSIFLMIGSNDVGQEIHLGTIDMDTIKSNYSKIINNILRNNVQLFIQSTLYTNMIDINGGVQILNNYLVEQSKLLSIQYIDINWRLLDNNLLSKRYSYDGSHLNGDGYIIWKEIISPYVNDSPP